MKKGLIAAGVIIFIIGLSLVNLFVYPFFATNPNYSDVERVFNKMQFPADWQEVRSSENQGIAGRACPIESSSTCFHKSKSFNIPKSTTTEDVKNIISQTGCSAISGRDNTDSGSEKTKTVLSCSVEGMRVGADYTEGEYFSITVYSQ